MSEMDTIDYNQLMSRDQILTTIDDVALKDQPPLLQRSWVSVCEQTSRSADIRVMQWNLLAQALSGGDDNFVKCPVDALLWSKRRHYIVKEILIYNADVICLQEVDFFEFLNSVLSKVGYIGVFKPKLDSPCLNQPNNTGPDGCACFYKSDKLELLKEEGFILAPDHSYINQVALLLTFRAKAGFEFGVLTTHLKAKLGCEEVRLIQGRYILSFLLEKADKLPLILCGDYNAVPSEPVYEAFSNSALDLLSVYTKLSPQDSEPPFTTWKIRDDCGRNKDVCKTIDYIWCSRTKFSISALVEIPSEEQVGINRFPSHNYPSDHLSLVADFIFQS